MADAVVVRLVGGPDHPGELDAAGFRGLLAAVQLLSTRVGRHLVDQARPGRSAGVVERSARVRVVGLDGEGTATVLRFAVGEEGVLGDGLEHEITDALFELVRGLWNEEPPSWTTPLLGEACVELLDALARVARTAAFGGARFREVSFAPAALSREAWPREDAPRRYGAAATVRGRLDRVDLRRRVLRVLDESGADVVVESVLAGYDVEGDPLVAAARLLGSEVVVTGPASRGPGGLRLRGATVRPA
ncbi:hypothetical protein [Actinomycetospora termitidis]|uniref:Uncharacterized protein n=1 Tax=Actinomycetospora termitidis TaxID=3053470 RepID=A0ABT7MDD0_9PSEU|nr:hypothetical protein [Actinomycetospora sp. Odt1-22]MDL5158676.1 hypothetical protein [Actinomycetospora sp. Odt1-22]